MRSAVRAELLKVRTVPGLVLGAVLATLLHPLATLLVATGGGIADGETVVAGSSTGALAGLLTWGLWAALAAVGEHQHGTLAPGVVALGGTRRALGRLLVAKAVAFGGVAVAGSGLGAVLALAAARAVTPSGERDLGALTALLAVPAVAATVVVGAVAAGLLVRGAGAAAALVAGTLLVPKAAAGLLGGLQPWVVGASPGTVLTQVLGLGGLASDQRFPLGAGAALVVVLGAGAVLLLASHQVLTRRR